MSKRKRVLSVKIEGLDELRKAFDALEAQTREDTLLRAAKAGAEVLEEEANRRAPGPDIETREAKSGAAGALIEIGPDKKHWYYQFAETGAQAHEISGTPLIFQGDQGLIVTGKVQHPGRAAAPFLRPAIDAAGGGAKDAAGDILRDAVLDVAHG